MPGAAGRCRVAISHGDLVACYWVCERAPFFLGCRACVRAAARSVAPSEKYGMGHHNFERVFRSRLAYRYYEYGQAAPRSHALPRAATRTRLAPRAVRARVVLGWVGETSRDEETNCVFTERVHKSAWAATKF